MDENVIGKSFFKWMKSRKLDNGWTSRSSQALGVFVFSQVVSFFIHCVTFPHQFFPWVPSNYLSIKGHWVINFSSTNPSIAILGFIHLFQSLVYFHSHISRLKTSYLCSSHFNMIIYPIRKLYISFLQHPNTLAFGSFLSQTQWWLFL